MKQRPLSELSVADLVNEFAAIGTEQDKALIQDDNETYTPLF